MRETDLIFLFIFQCCSFPNVHLSSYLRFQVIIKALVRSKKLAALALALSWRICARAHAQFFRDPALALALKTF